MVAFRVYDEFDGESIRAEPGGALRVTTHMPLADGWLYGYLLSFGGQAEVVSPPEVRHELARRAQLTARRYEKFLPPDLNLSQDVRFDAVYCTHPHEGEDDIQEVYEMEQKFCQSCGMPLGDVEGQYGTEKDGSHNHDYCSYCYQNGAFTRDCSMEEMIDYCVPYMVQGNPGMTEEKARESMRQFFHAQALGQRLRAKGIGKKSPPPTGGRELPKADGSRETGCRLLFVDRPLPAPALLAVSHALKSASFARGACACVSRRILL